MKSARTSLRDIRGARGDELVLQLLVTLRITVQKHGPLDVPAARNEAPSVKLACSKIHENDACEHHKPHFLVMIVGGTSHIACRLWRKLRRHTSHDSALALRQYASVNHVPDAGHLVSVIHGQFRDSHLGPTVNVISTKASTVYRRVNWPAQALPHRELAYFISPVASG